MKEIKPSDSALISGGAASTIPDPETLGLDPSPVAQAQPIPPELSPGREPVMPASGNLPAS